MVHYDWQKIEREQLNPKMARQVVHSANMTVARVFLTEGVLVPPHQHINEQITMVERGRLRFTIDGKDVFVAPGEILVMEPNVPHGVEALEDSIVVDLFAPGREDWKRGDDAYLRQK